MTSMLTNIRENPDKYPVSNIRWSYGVAFFVLPCAFVGIQEQDWKVALGGGILGLSACLFLSFGMYGVENHQDSLAARVVLSLMVALLLTTGIAVLGLILLAAVEFMTLPIALGVVSSVIFLATMAYLNP